MQSTPPEAGAAPTDSPVGTSADAPGAEASSRRGRLRRTDKALSAEEVEAYLRAGFCGRTATIGADGYPYVVPNLYVWRDAQVFLHTAQHGGHFLANVRHDPHVSFEVDTPGEVFPYGNIECDTSVSYTSVILFGRIRIVEQTEEKIAFYASFMQKYAPPDSWGRERGSFPRLDGTVVYAITPESMTGKRGVLPPLDERWPARNKTLSPGWTSAAVKAPPAGLQGAPGALDSD